MCVCVIQSNNISSQTFFFEMTIRNLQTHTQKETKRGINLSWGQTQNNASKKEYKERGGKKSKERHMLALGIPPSLFLYFYSHILLVFLGLFSVTSAALPPLPLTTVYQGGALLPLGNLSTSLSQLGTRRNAARLVRGDYVFLYGGSGFYEGILFLLSLGEGKKWQRGGKRKRKEAKGEEREERIRKNRQSKEESSLPINGSLFASSLSLYDNMCNSIHLFCFSSFSSSNLLIFAKGIQRHLETCG